jgi:hypothetical protein
MVRRPVSKMPAEDEAYFAARQADRKANQKAAFEKAYSKEYIAKLADEE